MGNFKVLFLIMSIHLFAEASHVQEIAQRSLQTNITKLNSTLFLSAGANQFKSFWTRDFCFSARGLLAINRADVVKSHLTYLIENRRADNLVPLYVDSMNPVNRVIQSSLFRAIRLKVNTPVTEDIKPYYLVNGTYEAIDSNLMVLYASLLYVQRTGDQACFNSHKEDFRKIFDFYKNKKLPSIGLLWQNQHADWQDSARRTGFTFFTNLLYYHMGIKYGFLSQLAADQLRNRIVTIFYDRKTGLFRSIGGRDQISLEGNLWAIEHNLIANREILYNNLTKHELFRLNGGIPGFATFPSYTKDDTYIQVKVTGLQEYHGKIYWSWLLGYSAKIALMMNDSERFIRIYKKLAQVINRDQTVYEIYNHNANLTPFKSFLYSSEAPFSWGSSFILDLERDMALRRAAASK
jgi:hypothetical protein